MTPLLELRNLKVAFAHQNGRIEAVRGIDLVMGRERIGIVGESGSGKSMTGRAIMRLIDPSAEVTADRMVLDGEDLLAIPEKRMRQIRGRRVAMVMQDPKYSLNPVMTVGQQIGEALRLHRSGSSGRDIARGVQAALASVRMRDPERVAGLYPHELSGGMGQRVMIAMMLAPGPDLLIADEPTSALDVTVQLQVLAILDDLVAGRGMGLIFISHDLELVSSFCDRIHVMYAGRIVETCAAKELPAARHPYTRALLASVPVIGDRRAELPALTRDPAWIEGR